MHNLFAPFADEQKQSQEVFPLFDVNINFKEFPFDNNSTEK